MYVNRFITRLSLNYWHLKKQGVPWDFHTESSETILITGGCSGFGKEMVKMFGAQTKAKLVVLDVQELPDELKDGQSSGCTSLSQEILTCRASSTPLILQS